MSKKQYHLVIVPINTRGEAEALECVLKEHGYTTGIRIEERNHV